METREGVQIIQINRESLCQMTTTILFNLRHCPQSIQRRLAPQCPLQGEHHLKTVGCRSVTADLIYPSESLLQTVTHKLVGHGLTIIYQSECRAFFFLFFSNFQNLAEM